MFDNTQNNAPAYKVYRFFELLYHGIVREVRKQHRSPIIGLATDIFQSMLYVVFFLFFMNIMGMRQAAIRGSEVLYIMTGVFLFLVHIRAVAAVIGTKGPLNPMNLHSSMNTLLNILAATLATLYTQILAFAIMIFAANVLFERIIIYDAKRFAFAFFVAWIAGVAIGNLLLSLSVFFPRLMKLVSQMFQRLNMVFSGKFFLANAVPTSMFWMFSWNPLFHVIDYARDAAFINYTATRTNIHHALWVTFAIFVISFMLDHWARKYASESWKSRT